MAYDQIEPIGEHRQDYRIATLCSVITNLFLAETKNPKYTSTEDYLFHWDVKGYKLKPKKKQTMKDMKNIMLAIAKDHNRKFE